MRSLKNSYRSVFIIVAAVSAALAVDHFIFSAVRIVGNSMQPTLEKNDWVLVSRLPFEPAYGDIVVFRKKDVSDETIVKRIIGIPGDTVEIKNGVIYINGEKKENDFSLISDEYNMEQITVDSDGYFVMGDNRAESNDSRKWADPLVRFEEIKGKVIVSFFPDIRKLT